VVAGADLSGGVPTVGGVRIRIEGVDLPGRFPGGEADRLRRDNVHVGVQRRGPGDAGAAVVDRVRAHAGSATWRLDVASREVDGLLDVGGPWVHGRPGARFLYLAWGAVDGDAFAMFRRAKLMFGDVPAALLRAAHDGPAALVVRVRLTDPDGSPACARLRPPQVSWTVGPP
jgi:Family of unknown function (DUF5990)